MLGPFEGQLLDADTQRPIADAVVWCSWSFARGVGNTAAEAARTMATHTDVDGRYFIPALRDLPSGLSTRLARFSLVAYKKGYVAYRHDRVFGQGRRHRLFSQWGNRVLLSRWSPELSHARHLLFIGNGKALQQASKWEVLAAAAELDGRRRSSQLTANLETQPDAPAATRSKLKLDASVLLSSEDIRAVTGYTGALQRGRLRGPRSEAYDTYHYRAKDRPERYDVAVRVWRLEDDKLTARYDKLLGQLPGSKQTDEVADRSFKVAQGEIMGLGFVIRASNALVLLTCGKGQCSSDAQLLQLAKRVLKNTSKLPSLSEDDSTLAPGPGELQQPSLEELAPGKSGKVDEDED